MIRELDKVGWTTRRKKKSIYEFIIWLLRSLPKYSSRSSPFLPKTYISVFLWVNRRLSGISNYFRLIIARDWRFCGLVDIGSILFGRAIMEIITFHKLFIDLCWVWCVRALNPQVITCLVAVWINNVWNKVTIVPTKYNEFTVCCQMSISHKFLRWTWTYHRYSSFHSCCPGEFEHWTFDEWNKLFDF